MEKNELKVVELFAGVGGFRVALEKSSNLFKTIWANQWEPKRKAQHAFDCYVSHFGALDTHINEDISLVKQNIPPHDLLVGGFPCQDYSVAKTSAKGIEGKKGELWWEIRDIIQMRTPKFILLENVDRLIKSPSKQRGRDFAIMLRCLYDLGYAVEWRVINAAEYGYAQRRRRVFIFAYKNTTNIFGKLLKNISENNNCLSEWILSEGFYAPIFPVEKYINTSKISSISITEEKYPSVADISSNFKNCFYNTGVMINGEIYSAELIPVYRDAITLRDICHKKKVNDEYFIGGNIDRWKYFKGAKKIKRIKPNGEEYFFSEGNMSFPDDLDKPSRTILTGESTVNRSTHIIEDNLTGKLRLLTPVECERLNGFEDNWTNTGMPNRWRYFTMGNALVIPIVTRIGSRILDIER